VYPEDAALSKQIQLMNCVFPILGWSCIMMYKNPGATNHQHKPQTIAEVKMKLHYLALEPLCWAEYNNITKDKRDYFHYAVHKATDDVAHITFKGITL